MVGRPGFKPVIHGVCVLCVSSMLHCRHCSICSICFPFRPPLKIPIPFCVFEPPTSQHVSLADDQVCSFLSAFCLAMRQWILGSHTPPCQRRMVITTQSSVLPCCTVAQTSSVPLQVAFDGALGLAISTFGSGEAFGEPAPHGTESCNSCSRTVRKQGQGARKWEVGGKICLNKQNPNHSLSARM